MFLNYTTLNSRPSTRAEEGTSFTFLHSSKWSDTRCLFLALRCWYSLPQNRHRIAPDLASPENFGPKSEEDFASGPGPDESELSLPVASGAETDFR